ncbi:sugar porter family MFS transporter [Pseudomaricurvus alcaniphilus]|uniref:sugar porter family MFS transporter n=1 Tax=Pseudomaricurvus alcaniphilus TaxID=1166482 RepID=UPI00140D391E|nr:sugar porter family MFS transporter [Pseudomaricurvus alcaniphilus]NHN38381.1 sugar porter family MFS transporter [Pseudomaricurvus alcaniphilus]
MNSYQLTAFRYALIVALGGFIFGLDAALISGTVRFISTEFGLSDLQVGAVVSAPGFGVIFALLVTGQICNRLGRKNALLIIAALYLVSALTSVVAPNFELLVAARFLGGLAFTSLSVASMYIGEVSPPEMRGKLVSMNQINIVFGLSAAYFANYAILQASNSGADWVDSVGITAYTWRWMLAVEVVPAAIWLGLLLTIPESPRWLILKGRLDDARRVMARIMPLATIEQHISEIRESASHGHADKNLRAQIADLFDPRIRTAMIIGLTVAIVQPITGINAIMFYAPTVFEQVGIGTDAAFMQSVIVGLVSVVFTLIALVLIDRLGRRPLMMFGLAWAALSLFACSWGFADAVYLLDAEALAQLADKVDVSLLQGALGIEYSSDVMFKEALRGLLGDTAARAYESDLLQSAIHINTTLVLLGITGFIAAFHISVGPIMWVLFSEIFPIHVRGIAIPCFALLTAVVNYFVQQFFPWQLTNMGAAEIFLFYAVAVTIGLVALFKLLPETKNKSIEEIEIALGSASASPVAAHSVVMK